MNGRLLKNILDSELLPSAALNFRTDPPEQWYLLQDNSPVHKSHIVQNWLHNHGITLIDFPPYSPDLNPIENLWQDVEKRVEKRKPSSFDELQEAVTEEWKNTSTDFIRKLARSMPQRCRLVIEAKGDHIHY